MVASLVGGGLRGGRGTGRGVGGRATSRVSHTFRLVVAMAVWDSCGTVPHFWMAKGNGSVGKMLQTVGNWALVWDGKESGKH